MIIIIKYINDIDCRASCHIHPYIYPYISRVQCSQGAEVHRVGFLPPSQLHGLSQARVIYREGFGKAAQELPLAPTPGNSQLLKNKKPSNKFYHLLHAILEQHKASTPTDVWMCIFGVGFSENSLLHFSIPGEKGISAERQKGQFGK